MNKRKRPGEGGDSLSQSQKAKRGRGPSKVRRSKEEGQKKKNKVAAKPVGLAPLMGLKRAGDWATSLSPSLNRLGLRLY